MYKFLITDKIDNTYDKIFKIINKHTIFTTDSENEYNTDKGYVVEIKNLPAEAYSEIIELKNVEEI